MLILIQLFVRWFLIGPIYEMNQVSFALSLTDFLLLILATVFIAAGGYCLNDIFDVDTDRINKPSKVLIGNPISEKLAWKLYWALSMGGLLLGLWLSLRVGVFNTFFIFIFSVAGLWFYSTSFKYKLLVGNFLISFLAAVSLALPWLMEFLARLPLPDIFVEGLRAYPLIHSFVGLYTGFAFMVTLVREIVKDAEDITGDQAFGARTVPTVFGFEKTKIILLGLVGIVVLALMYLSYRAFEEDFINLFLYVLLLCAFGLFIMQNIWMASHKKEFSALSLYLKVFMAAGVFSMQLLYLEF
jgi:4-hydroxybenzoate polyprenyltransferase